jgi:hypothetical protein
MGEERRKHTYISTNMSVLCPVCEDHVCFWTISIVLFLFKTTHDISETGFCPHLQVEPTQVGPLDI